MSDSKDIDEDSAHRHFAARCFNRCWELMDQSHRTEAECEEMLAASFASYWHWLHREDHSAVNLSVAYWQLSRVHALLDKAQEAKHWGERCLGISQAEELPAFYVAFGHEALARAAQLRGDEAALGEHLHEAMELAAQLQDSEERKLLLPDLADLGADIEW